jgi:hypothetical protein
VGMDMDMWLYPLVHKTQRTPYILVAIYLVGVGTNGYRVRVENVTYGTGAGINNYPLGNSS